MKEVINLLGMFAFESDNAQLVTALILDAKNISMKVEPIFVTIDPARDGPDQLKNYLSDWHPRIIGLVLASIGFLCSLCGVTCIELLRCRLELKPRSTIFARSTGFTTAKRSWVQIRLTILSTSKSSGFFSTSSV